MSDIAAEIIRAAGKKGKTKPELAEATGYSLSHTAKTVNNLLFANKLEIVGKRGKADVFAKATEKPEVVFTK